MRHQRSRIAKGLPPISGQAAEYPSLAKVAGNLAGAATRFLASGLARVTAEEFDRRWRYADCPQYDHAPAPSAYAAVSHRPS